MITHLQANDVEWAVCGERTDTFTASAPTCLGCAAGTWLAEDNKDARYLDWLGNRIAAAIAVPREFLGHT